MISDLHINNETTYHNFHKEYTDKHKVYCMYHTEIYFSLTFYDLDWSITVRDIFTIISVNGYLKMLEVGIVKNE